MTTIVQIFQKENAVLRKKAKPVLVSKIASKQVQSVIAKMKKALDAQHDGVAIAAPQIGESLRIFVVSGKIFHEDFLKSREKRLEEKKNAVDAPIQKNKHSDLVFINPIFEKKSRDKKKMPEGCLSVRWIYGNVERSVKATVTAHDENGKKFTRGASGLLAQIFQHEIDHLDGILFIDKATDMEEMLPEKK